MEEEQSRQQKVSFKILYLIHLEYAPLKDRIDSKIREMLSNKNRALSFKAIMAWKVIVEELEVMEV